LVVESLVDDGDVGVEVVIIDLYVVRAQSDAVVSYFEVEAVRVVILSAIENLRWHLDRCVNVDLGVECRAVHVEGILQRCALSEHEVGSGHGLNFPVLQGAILIVEAFRSCACRRCQILKVLEFPIGPAHQVLVRDLGYLSDLLGARSLGKASSEF